jgi:hypothetical protein
MPHNSNPKLVEFFQRLNNRKIQLKNTLPNALVGLIERKDLNKIYRFLDKNKEKISKILKNGQSYRLDKKNSHLPRTLNFIFDPKTGDVQLILETKSKTHLNKKDLNAKSFSGAFKTTKVAWRIDSEKPQKIANAVFYIEDKDGLHEAEIEALAAQAIVKKNPGQDCFVNAPVLGQLIDIPGMRKSENPPTPYTQKLSFYSPWANGGSLFYFLRTPEAKSFNVEQLEKLAIQLLKAVKSLHDADMVHQDIKTDNILVFQDELGNYRLELADFGKAYTLGSTPAASVHSTAQYESPEIAALAKDPKSPHHAYFYDKAYPSYGRDLGKQMNALPEYALPHKSNDMWAIGVVIHELFHKDLPNVKSQAQFSPLILGLLDPNRTSRMTADKALAVALKIDVQQPIKQPEAATQVVPFLTSNAAFHPGFKSVRAKVSPFKKKIPPSKYNLLGWFTGCIKRKRA